MFCLTAATGPPLCLPASLSRLDDKLITLCLECLPIIFSTITPKATDVCASTCCSSPMGHEVATKSHVCNSRVLDPTSPSAPHHGRDFLMSWTRMRAKPLEPLKHKISFWKIASRPSQQKKQMNDFIWLISLVQDTSHCWKYIVIFLCVLTFVRVWLCNNDNK